jgi:hypothetical protein
MVSVNLYAINLVVADKDYAKNTPNLKKIDVLLVAALE